MYALRKLTGAEIKLFRREPMVAFFSIAFPALLVGILGSVKTFRQPDKGLGGLRVIDLYVTIAVTLVIAMLALQYTPAVLATYRERGILRRMSTTPVAPLKLLAAQLITSLLVLLAAVVIVVTVGRVAFSVALPSALFGFFVALVLTAGALFSVGLLVAALAPSGKAGNAIGTVLFFPTMFFAGLWTPRESFPPVLRHISDLTPLGAGEQALRDASAGSFPHAGQLLVLVAYILVFGALSARLFRWE
jgi:ABC-2 type transport system permease protein